MARTALDHYVLRQHALGHDITISGLHAALHQEGVQRVHLIEPTDHIVIGPAEAAYCTETRITDGGTDV